MPYWAAMRQDACTSSLTEMEFVFHWVGKTEQLTLKHLITESVTAGKFNTPNSKPPLMLLKQHDGVRNLYFLFFYLRGAQ